MHGLILILVSYNFEDHSTPSKTFGIIKVNQLPWWNEDSEEKVTFVSEEE